MDPSGVDDGVMTATPLDHIYSVADGAVMVTVQSSLYPRESVLLTAQRFTDTCWIEVGEVEGKGYLITIKPKEAVDSELLEQLGKRFMNHVFIEVRRR